MSLFIQHHCYTPRSLGSQRFLVAHDGVMTFNNSIGMQMAKTQQHGSMCMVVDGMSGLKNDRLAVELAIQMFQKLYEFSPPTFAPEHLKQFIEQSHQEIRTSINQRNLPLMGCSLALLWLFEGKVIWLSVGDCRIYHHRGSQLEQITRDQNVAEFVSRGWMNVEPSEKLAQGWLFGSKIPNQAQHIFLAEGYDFGAFDMVFGDQFLMVNHDFDALCSLEHRSSILLAPSFQPFPFTLAQEECCVIRISIQ